MSKGEEKIVNLLEKEGIIFQREKRFNDLKHGLFRYDFFIKNYNGDKIIIEFNGEQHYHFVKRFYKNPVEWRTAQEHDRRKISYALANGIKIYIIPFWEIDNIQTAKDLFSEVYLAKTRWKNDEDARKFTATKQKQ